MVGGTALFPLFSAAAPSLPRLPPPPQSAAVGPPPGMPESRSALFGYDIRIGSTKWTVTQTETKTTPARLMYTEQEVSYGNVSFYTAWFVSPKRLTLFGGKRRRHER